MNQLQGQGVKPRGQGQAPGVNSVSGQETSQRGYLVLFGSEENHPPRRFQEGGLTTLAPHPMQRLEAPYLRLCFPDSEDRLRQGGFYQKRPRQGTGTKALKFSV